MTQVNSMNLIHMYSIKSLLPEEKPLGPLWVVHIHYIDLPMRHLSHVFPQSREGHPTAPVHQELQKEGALQGLLAQGPSWGRLRVEVESSRLEKSSSVGLCPLHYPGHLKLSV